MIDLAGASTVNNLLLWVGELGGFALLIGFAIFKKFGANRRSIAQMVGSALDARAARIDAQLRMAEENRAEAAKAREQAQAEIHQAHAEAEQIVSRSGGMVEALRSEMETAANEDGERIVAQARSAIETERNRAVLELRTAAADVAVDAAREVLKRQLDDQADQMIIRQSLANGTGHDGSGGPA